MSYLTEDNSSICETCGGKCCKYILLNCRKDDKYKIDFWEVQGNELIEETDTDVIYMQRAPCQHNKKGRCDIYEDRPLLCKEFPRKNLPLLWQKICPLFHERNKNDKGIMQVFK